jgi:hypothetical protein
MMGFQDTCMHAPRSLQLPRLICWHSSNHEERSSIVSRTRTDSDTAKMIVIICSGRPGSASTISFPFTDNTFSHRHIGHNVSPKASIFHIARVVHKWKEDSCHVRMTTHITSHILLRCTKPSSTKSATQPQIPHLLQARFYTN